jgi:hypothetical protein
MGFGDISCLVHGALLSSLLHILHPLPLAESYRGNGTMDRECECASVLIKLETQISNYGN